MRAEHKATIQRVDLCDCIALTLVLCQVKSRQLWGDMRYTSDSDIVAVLMHLGYYAHFLIQAPSLVQEFRVLLKLLPSQEKYSSKSRFVRSRAWASGNSCSYQVSKPCG